MWWMAVSLAAEPERELLVRVEPAWIKPAKPASCEAELAIAADGSPTVTRLKGCGRNSSPVEHALSSWRYASGPESTLTVELSHDPDSPALLLRQEIPEWPADADARSCIARIRRSMQGDLEELEIAGCSDESEALVTEAVESWDFAPIPGPPTVHLFRPSSPDVELKKRVNPSPPAEGIPVTTRCLVAVSVAPSGVPQAVLAGYCGEPFASLAAEALAKWRWYATPAPWSTMLAITFKPR